MKKKNKGKIVGDNKIYQPIFVLFFGYIRSACKIDDHLKT